MPTCCRCTSAITLVSGQPVREPRSAPLPWPLGPIVSVTPQLDHELQEGGHSVFPTLCAQCLNTYWHPEGLNSGAGIREPVFGFLLLTLCLSARWLQQDRCFS